MIEALQRLAEIDAEEVNLQQKLAPFKARLAGIEERMREPEANAREARAVIESSQRRQRSGESDLQDVESRLASARRKYDAITTAKEALAAEHELSGMEAKRLSLEEEILESMEEIERRERIAAEASALLTTLREEREQLERDLSSAQVEIDERLKGLEHQRRDQLPALSPDLRKRYITLQTSHTPHPVLAVDAGVCPGCRIAFNPNNEAHLRAHRPVVCPHCRRILVPV